MLFLFFLIFLLSCDFQYTLSNHDPFYLEQFLQSGQTICINTTIENSIFILNSLGNSTFKIFDRFNKERELGYEEMYKSATAISFGKMTGALVITNTKSNISSISFISLAAISFPKDECEIKAISNLQKNFIISTFEDSNICYFNGNGVNFRYQFFVPNGEIEIRPPQNLSNSIFIKHDLGYKLELMDVKQIVKSAFLNIFGKHKNQKNNILPSINYNITPESIFINNLTNTKKYDNPASFVRIDHYAPLIIYKPSKNTAISSEKTFFMELGANDYQYPYKLNSQFVSDQPGIIKGSEGSTKETSQRIFYGCDPYVHGYDEEGRKVVIDTKGRSISNYYLEILAKTIVLAVFLYVIIITIIIYFLSFCCICPCCCCYKLCTKISCCKLKNQNAHQSFEAANLSTQFMHVGSGSYSVSAETIESMNEEGFHDENINDDDNVNDYNNVNENNENRNVYIVNESPEQPVELVEEEEADDSINNVEEDYEMHNIDEHHIRDSTPQL